MGDEVQKEDIVQANVIVESLRSGKKLHDQFALAFGSRYQIAGKLMEEWKEYFNISVPPDINPSQCREFGSQILGLYQEATFYKATSEARLQSLKGSGASSFRRAFANLVAEYRGEGKKLPSKDTLQNLAEEEGKDIQDAIIHGDIEVSFWKSVISNLDICRKIVDTISISLSVEAKALRDERFWNKNDE